MSNPENDRPVDLHAIIIERPGGLMEARLIELNIVVAGRSNSQLLDEFSHAIEAHYEIAMESNLTPFANLCRHPQENVGEMSNLFEEMGIIRLPKEVAWALAIAVHAPAPSSPHIKGLRKAA